MEELVAKIEEEKSYDEMIAKEKIACLGLKMSKLIEQQEQGISRKRIRK